MQVYVAFVIKILSIISINSASYWFLLVSESFIDFFLICTRQHISLLYVQKDHIVDAHYIKKIFYKRVDEPAHSYTYPSMCPSQSWKSGQARPLWAHPENISHFPAHCWGSFSKASSWPSSISLLKRPMSWEGPGCPNLLWVTLHHAWAG